MFQFKLKNKDGHARTGIFSTPHGDIETPTFMPVGTLGAVRTLSPDELHKLETQIILSNTYHLYLRPGDELIKKMGGLHKWTGWNGPILTDSGGYQVFSLKAKISDEGVEFQSHLDGSKHFFTPEKAIKIQENLGADIIMAFDECAPADSSKTYASEAMRRTHAWALRCKKAHILKNQAMFPIVQGVTYKELRVDSAKFMADLDLPGIAIGGLSVGEGKKLMYETLETVEPHLPLKKPRYLMGVGTPEDLLECVERGMDMFDCVLATRLARHGTFWDNYGRHKISQFKEDQSPPCEDCECYACQNFSKSYISHLVTEKEVLGIRLLTIHNIHFLLKLMRRIQKNINEGTFTQFKKSFLKKYAHRQGK